MWEWGPEIANSWRTTGDIKDNFNTPSADCYCDKLDCHDAGKGCSAMNIFNRVPYYSNYPNGGPGWNDLDMLEVGNGEMSDEAYKTHFSLWALVKSSFLLGNDLRNMDAETYSIITNPAIIALNQDENIAATRVWHSGNETVFHSLWTSTSSNGDQVFALVNGEHESLEMNATLPDIFGSNHTAKAYEMYDLWGDRLDTETSNNILNGNETASKHLYNATEQSYADGLKNNVKLLLGKHVGTIRSNDTITTNVPASGIAIYRLKQA